LGGDRNPTNDTALKIWRSMAAGIQAGTGGKGNALITYHPQPNEQGSGQYFFNDEWLSVNMFQNGHCRNTPVYDKIYKAWLRHLLNRYWTGNPSMKITRFALM
jgi:hypothetical protein